MSACSNSGRLEKTNFYMVESPSTLNKYPDQKDLNKLLKHSLPTPEKLFKSNALLMRAVSDETVFEPISDTGKPTLGSLGHEMEYMDSQKGLFHSSSTLAVPGEKVVMYHPIAFLFNGTTAKLDHIYGIDSNSCTSADGNLQVGNDSSLTFNTLGALATAIKTTDLLSRSPTNEVNGTFRRKDLVGLAARKISNPTHNAVLNLKIRSIQKLLFQKYKINLPIYKYNEGNGSLALIDSSRETILSELRALQNSAAYKSDRQDIHKFLLGQ